MKPIRSIPWRRLLAGMQPKARSTTAWRRRRILEGLCSWMPPSSDADLISLFVELGRKEDAQEALQR